MWHVKLIIQKDNNKKILDEFIYKGSEYKVKRFVRDYGVREREDCKIFIVYSEFTIKTLESFPAYWS